MWRGAFQYSLERFTVKGDECHICDLWWRLLQLHTIDTLCHAFGCYALLEATAVWGSSTVMADEKYHSDCNCSGLFLVEPVLWYQLFCFRFFLWWCSHSLSRQVLINYAVRASLPIKWAKITGFLIWLYSVDYTTGSSFYWSNSSLLTLSTLPRWRNWSFHRWIHYTVVYFYEDGFTQKSRILSYQVRTKPKSIENSLSRDRHFFFAISRSINYSLRFISNHFIL